MINDSLLLLHYQGFVSNIMPVLNVLQDQEQEILKKVNFFNKRSKYKEIKEKYLKFNQMVIAYWKNLYDNDNQLYESITDKNRELLLKGKSIYATTDIAILVEQFFLSLNLSVFYLIQGYDGIIELDKGYELSNYITKYMLKVMNTINTKYLNSVLPLYPIDE